MLIIHGIARSRAFRCLWAAEESGLPYRHEPADFRDPAQQEALRRIHPSAKVPLLQDGDVVLSESLAINLHIARRAGPPLWPGGDDLSRALQWSLFAATEVEPHTQRWLMNAVQLPEERRNAAEAAAGLAAAQRSVPIIAAALARGPCLLGEVFTVADLNLAGVLYTPWFNGIPLLTDAPHALAWLERCLTRPAALRARALREG
jgi:glutathione S-transferase